MHSDHGKLILAHFAGNLQRDMCDSFKLDALFADSKIVESNISQVSTSPDQLLYFICETEAKLTKAMTKGNISKTISVIVLA